MRRLVCFATLAFALSACASHDTAAQSLEAGLSEYSAADRNESAELLDATSEDDLPPDILARNPQQQTMASYEEWVSTQGAYYRFLDSCLQEKGWPEQTVSNANTPMQGMSLDGWQGRVPEFLADLDQCFAEYGPAPQPPELTADEARKDYQRAIRAAECFRKDGYEISAEPSEQVFVDQSLKGTRTWFPEDELPDEAYNSTYYQKCPW